MGVPPSSPAETPHANGDHRKQQVLAAEVRLLYGNANVGVGVTILATAILAYLQWGVIAHAHILGWCVYMFLVSAGRFILGRLYWRTPPPGLDTGRWRVAFA